MALHRTLDPTTLNAAANHPEVFPWLGAACERGELDLSALVANPANVAMAGKHGGFIAEKHEPGIYEVHSLFAPEGRTGLVAATQAGLRYLFAATDCVRVLTKVPASNRAAAGLARAAGFQPVFSRDAAWPTGDGPCAVSYQAITFERWVARDDVVLASGRAFHDRLESAKAAAGSALPKHDDDEAHDRAVGAAALMFQAANPHKAVWLYNQWARFAGYAEIALLSTNPVIVDLRDAVVEVRGNQMEILQCR